MISIANNGVEITRQLLQLKEIDIYKRAKTGNSSLMLTCAKGNVEILNHLLIKLKDDEMKPFVNAVNKLGQTGFKKHKIDDWYLNLEIALMFGCVCGSVECVEMLLDFEAEMDVVDEIGNSALHM